MKVANVNTPTSRMKQNLDRLLDCLLYDEDQGTFSVDGRRREEFNYGIAKLVDDTHELDRDYHLISHERMKWTIVDYLSYIKSYAPDDPYAEFETSIEHISGEIQSWPTQKYDIYFPLNINGGSECPNSITIAEHELEHVSKSEWRANYKEKMTEARNDWDKFGNLFEKSPNKFDDNGNSRSRLAPFVMHSSLRNLGVGIDFDTNRA